MASVRPLVRLQAKDVDCLFEARTLTPEAVNAFLRLIERRSRFYVGLPIVWAFPVDFFREWNTGGFDQARQFIRDINVFEQELLLFPIFTSSDDANGLWAIVVCRPGSQTICVYDPLLADRQREAKVVFSFLARAAEEQGSHLDEKNWKFLSTPVDYPQPQKPELTGVFVCACVYCVTLAAPFGKLQLDEKAWRRDIAAALRRGRFGNEQFDLFEDYENVEQGLRYGGRVEPALLSRMKVTASSGSSETVEVAVDPVSFRAYKGGPYAPTFRSNSGFSEVDQRATESRGETKPPKPDGAESPTIPDGAESPTLSITADSIVEEINEICGKSPLQQNETHRSEETAEDLVDLPDRPGVGIVERDSGFKLTIPWSMTPLISPILSDVSSPAEVEPMDANGPPTIRENRLEAEIRRVVYHEVPPPSIRRQEVLAQTRNPLRNRGRKRTRKFYRVRYQREDGTIYRKKFLKDEYRFP